MEALHKIIDLKHIMLLLSLFCRAQLLATPWTAAYQAPLSMDFPGKSTGVGCHCLLRTHIIVLQKCYFLLSPPIAASQVALVEKNLPSNAGDIREWVRSLGQEDPQEEGMQTHSSILS